MLRIFINDKAFNPADVVPDVVKHIIFNLFWSNCPERNNRGPPFSMWSFYAWISWNWGCWWITLTGWARSVQATATTTSWADRGRWGLGRRVWALRYRGAGGPTLQGTVHCSYLKKYYKLEKSGIITLYK